MALSKEYLQFILERLSNLEEISYKKMVWHRTSTQTATPNRVRTNLYIKAQLSIQNPTYGQFTGRVKYFYELKINYE